MCCKNNNKTDRDYQKRNENDNDSIKNDAATISAMMFTAKKTSQIIDLNHQKI